MIELQLPQDIIFSSYAYRRIPSIIKEYGKRPLIVTGRRAFLESSWGQEILKILKKNRISYILFSGIKPEPTFEFVERGILLAGKEKCDMVLGIGGGSVLDVAKAIAGLFREQFSSVSEYLHGKEILNSGLPYIAVPTTSGSGSEVTKNAVLIDTKDKIKASVREKRFLARVAIVDPVLTLTLPKKQSLYSALDALTHALESYVSKGANILTQVLSLKAVEIIYSNLPQCLKRPGDLFLREKLSFASLLAGISFANAGLGLAHALSHPLGVLFKLPHGLVNAILIPEVVKFNYRSSKSQYSKLLNYLSERRRNDLKLYDMLRDFNKRLNIPLKFSQLGIVLDKRKEEEIIRRLAYSGSLKYNPYPVDKNILKKILENLW